MATFIEINVDDGEYTEELRKKLVAVCPVDIFAVENTRVKVRPEQEDECILCEACLDLAPVRTLQIRKTYSNECLMARGEGPNIESLDSDSNGESEPL